MPWYGWVFGLLPCATLIWSFVELSLPLLLLVAGFVRWRFFLRAALVFATSLWAFMCLNTLIQTGVVAANAGEYRPATFTVRRHVVARGEGAGTPHTVGVIDDRHEEVFVRAAYLDEATPAGVATAVPVGSRLPVLYNPDVSGWVRVVEPTDDLVGREWARFAKWAALGLLPWVVALVVRFRWRATLQPELSDAASADPASAVLGSGAVRVRAADLGVAVAATPISSSTTLSTPLRPRFRVIGDTLTLETARGVRGLGWVMLGWGVAAAGAAVVALVRDWDVAARVVFVGQGTVLPLIGLFLVALPARHEFDRAAGVYRKRSLVAPARRPLSGVLAVQVIPGRAGETTDGHRYESWELNLVLADGARSGVACLADGAWVRAAGRAVAEFLGVPVIDAGPG